MMLTCARTTLRCLLLCCPLIIGVVFDAHGQDDKTVPYENVVRFEKVMTEAGNRCELASFEGVGHGFFNPGRDDGYYDAVLATMDTFSVPASWGLRHVTTPTSLPGTGSA